MEGLDAAALGIDVCELGEFAGLSVSEELGEGLDVSCGSAAGDCPIVEKGVRGEGGVGVVYPGDVILGELLEDGSNVQCIDFEGNVVASMAGRGASSDVCAVGIGGAGHGAEPLVEKDKVFCEGLHDRDVVFVVVLDRFCCAGEIRGFEGELLLEEEALHGLHGGGGGVKGAEELHVYTTDAVVWVVGGNVGERGGGADGAEAGVGGIDGVTELFAYKPVDVMAVGETTCYVVEGPVLLHKDDDVLYARREG